MPCRMTTFLVPCRCSHGCLPPRIWFWSHPPPPGRGPVCVADRARGVLLAHASEARPIKAPPAQGPLFAFHVTLNILAYSAFAISFVLSVIFLLQNRVSAITSWEWSGGASQRSMFWSE